QGATAEGVQHFGLPRAHALAFASSENDSGHLAHRVSIILPWTTRVTIRVYPKNASGPPLSAVAKMQQKALDPRRNRRGAFDRLPESRMDKRESGRVECIAVERDRRARTGLSIDRVADDRVPQRRQMDANLVGTPGLEANLQQREVGKALEHAIAGDRALAAAGRTDRHLHPIGRMAPD